MVRVRVTIELIEDGVVERSFSQSSPFSEDAKADGIPYSMALGETISSLFRTMEFDHAGVYGLNVFKTYWTAVSTSLPDFVDVNVCERVDAFFRELIRDVKD